MSGASGPVVQANEVSSMASQKSFLATAVDMVMGRGQRIALKSCGRRARGGKVMALADLDFVYD